ncbi:MAG: purple acid phosphatase family protein [Promethearchaeota archaeon]
MNKKKKHGHNVKTLWVCLFLISTMLFFPIMAKANNDQVNSSSSDIIPRGIRLTIINDPSNSIVITWSSKSKAPDPHVHYSTKSTLDDSKEVHALFEIINNTHIYKVELSGLEPSTTYYFKVYSSDKNGRELMTFTTAPGRDATNVKFIVWGDSRSQPEVRKEFSKKVMEYFGDDIDFIVHLGDIVEEGRYQNLWDLYFSDTEVINGNKQGFYIEGNHEDGLDTKMYDNIPLPSNGQNSRYYSFSWGPISFVGLNTNEEGFWGPQQKMPLSWLESELSRLDNDKYTLWKVAFMHHPLFNDREDRSDEKELIQTWGSLFDEYEVDLVFAGHNHCYERSYPMSHDKEFDNSCESNFFEPDFPMYLIAGGAGAPLDDDFEEKENMLPEYVAHYNSSYNFLLVNLEVDEIKEETTLSLEAWGMPRNYSGLYLFDKIAITKDLPNKYINKDSKIAEILFYRQRIPEILDLILYFSIIGVIFYVVDIALIKGSILKKSLKIKQGFIKDEFESEINKKLLWVNLVYFISISLTVAVVISVYIIYIEFPWLKMINMIETSFLSLYYLFCINFFLLEVIIYQKEILEKNWEKFRFY